MLCIYHLCQKFGKTSCDKIYHRPLASLKPNGSVLQSEPKDLSSALKLLM